MHDLEQRLHDPSTSHDERAQIGDLLNAAGDTRPGVGLRDDGIPDIDWCFVDVPPEFAGVDISFRNERGMEYGAFPLRPFFVARYPVTYRQFQAFVDAPDGFANAVWWRGMTERYRHQPMLDPRALLDNHPRESVSWYQAVAFGRWLTMKCSGEILTVYDESAPSVIGENADIRLPYEWEWQWAAQGADGREYPWGAWDGRYANTREARLGRLTAVGMYPQGAAWCGALDMSGSVWEWCLNEYGNIREIGYDAHNTHVLRGGSFADVRDWAVCGSRFNDLPNRRLDYFGFRVVCAPSG